MDKRQPQTIIRHLTREVKSLRKDVESYTSLYHQERGKRQEQAAIAHKFEQVAGALIEATARFDRCAELQIKLENMIAKQRADATDLKQWLTWLTAFKESQGARVQGEQA